jgi:hypothetical protein
MKLLLMSLLFFLVACSIPQIKKGAEKIQLTKEKPYGCEYLGDVTGGAGGSVSGEFISDDKLEEGARNDLKNKAFILGGDHIQLLSTDSGGDYGGKTSSSYTGAVYKCKDTVK